MQPDFTNTPEAREAEELVQNVVAIATGYRVTTPEQYAHGGEQLKQVKAAQKRLEDLRTAITGPLNAAIKAANNLFRAPAERLVSAETTIKRELIRYQDEQEAIRREEQRKADEAARREREKAEAAARAARAKAEAEAAELRARAEAEAAAGRASEAAKLAARAEQKVERADEKANALEVQAATTVAPVIQREAPKVTGVSVREVWKFEVTDPSKINPAFLMPDEKKIGAQVRAMRGDAAALIGPGVRVWVEKQLAAGAA